MSSRIHPLSVPSTKSELDLFVVPSTQMVISGNQTQWHLPISDFSNTKRIEFNIPPMQDFIDLNEIYLYVSFKLEKTVTTTENNATTVTTSNLVATDRLYPSPYFLNTMFNQVDLYLGNTRVTTQSPYYHMKSFLEATFFTTREAKDTYMKGAMWGDQQSRLEMCTDGKTVNLYGRIHLDMCQQDRLLIPMVPLRLIFTLNTDAVNFQCNNANTVPKFSLKDIRLSMRKFIVDDSAKIGIESALQTADAKYFITRGDVTTHHIHAGVRKVTINDLLKSVLPRAFIIGIIPNEDMVGELSTSSFKFDNHGVNSVAAYKGGQVINGIPFTPDYRNNIYMREYVDFYRALCQDNAEPMMNISYSAFKTDSCFYAFNLTPDQSGRGAEDGNANLLESDVIKLEIAFSSATTQTYDVVCFALYDNLITINANREAKIDY